MHDLRFAFSCPGGNLRLHEHWGLDGRSLGFWRLEVGFGFSVWKVRFGVQGLGGLGVQLRHEGRGFRLGI